MNQTEKVCGEEIYRIRLYNFSSLFAFIDSSKKILSVKTKHKKWMRLLNIFFVFFKPSQINKISKHRIFLYILLYVFVHPLQLFSNCSKPLTPAIDVRISTRITLSSMYICINLSLAYALWFWESLLWIFEYLLILRLSKWNIPRVKERESKISHYL